MEGQLTQRERELLYRIVKTSRPKLVVEVGTWYGGGSTLFIASALRDAGTGKLITCEPDIARYNSACSGYLGKPEFNIELLNCTARVLFKKLIDENSQIDFLFMDGSEDPSENIDDFRYIEGHLPLGSIVGFHDWDLDKREDDNISTKNKLLRPYMEGSSWVLLEYITRPGSVGMSFWSKPW